MSKGFDTKLTVKNMQDGRYEIHCPICNISIVPGLPWPVDRFTKIIEQFEKDHNHKQAEEEKTVYHLRMARASEEEMDSLLDFIGKIEEMYEEYVCGDDMSEWLLAYLDEHEGFPFSVDRIIFGYRTMFNAACDPEKTTLEWKPELERLFGQEKNNG